jgi:hypothetical protein
MSVYHVFIFHLPTHWPHPPIPPLRLAKVGTAYINCCGMVEPNMPWSGRKGSGLGQILSGMGPS